MPVLPSFHGNVNRYLAERKIMLQCWADMIDAWMMEYRRVN
jgi:hypothetical protein